MADSLEIEYVTHASLFLRARDVRLLLDPFFFPELDPILAPSVRNFPPRDLEPAHFGELDFIFSSHEHHDHCHPETLARLRDRVRTVLLPADRPALAARYTDLGYRDLVFLRNREPRALRDGLTVTAVWDDPIDSSLLIDAGGTVVLHGNDCNLELDTYRWIRDRAPVDYAFLCSTSIQQLFPLILPRPAAELEALATAREDAFFDEHVARIEALRPRVVIPYSYTATYVQPDQLRLNSCGRITPPIFRERLRARAPGIECWAIQPGDVVDARARAVRRARAENLWGEDLAGFRASLESWARGLELPRFDPGDPETCDGALRAHLERRLAEGVPHARFYDLLGGAVALRVTGAGGRSRRYVVDLAKRSVSLDDARPLLEIALPASLLSSMLAGAYDPFMILYTYRVAFAPPPRPRLEPAAEYLLYMGVMLTLFMDRGNPLLGDFAGLADYLSNSTTQ